MLLSNASVDEIGDGRYEVKCVSAKKLMMVHTKLE